MCRVTAHDESKIAAHACSKQNNSPKQNRHENCPHCDGSTIAALTQKPLSAPPGLSVADLPALHAPLAAALIKHDCTDSFVCPVLRASSLLELHCALLT
jgi:hypothetical protein